MAQGEPEAQAPVRPGDVLAGKYEVMSVLGVGGMGVVVAARHTQLKGQVAIKFLLREVAQHPEVVARFLREAQAATRIKSEHVARVLDVGTLDTGAPYMIMEFLEGQDLGQLLAHEGPLPIARAIDFVLQAMEALAEAHSVGIVHRDLKPSNLFLTQRADGSPLVKVLDFGISKTIASDANDSQLTRTQGFMGSPLYMSPEQIRSSKHVDARADVWSLGVILYELLSGTLPFGGDTASAVLASIIADSHVPLERVRHDAPPGLARALDRCLEKSADRRFPTVAELAVELAPFGSRDAELSKTRITGVVHRGRLRSVTDATIAAPEMRAQPAVTAGAWSGTAAPAPKRTWLLLGGVGGGVALLVAIVVAIIALSKGKDDAASAASASEAPVLASEPPPAASALIVPAPKASAAPAASAAEADAGTKASATFRSTSTKPLAKQPTTKSEPRTTATKPAGNGKLDGLIENRR